MSVDASVDLCFGFLLDWDNLFEEQEVPAFDHGRPREERFCSSTGRPLWTTQRGLREDIQDLLSLPENSPYQTLKVDWTNPAEWEETSVMLGSFKVLVQYLPTDTRLYVASYHKRVFDLQKAGTPASFLLLPEIAERAGDLPLLEGLQRKVGSSGPIGLFVLSQVGY